MTDPHTNYPHTHSNLLHTNYPLNIHTHLPIPIYPHTNSNLHHTNLPNNLSIYPIPSHSNLPNNISIYPIPSIPPIPFHSNSTYLPPNIHTNQTNSILPISHSNPNPNPIPVLSHSNPPNNANPNPNQNDNMIEDHMKMGINSSLSTASLSTYYPSPSLVTPMKTHPLPMRNNETNGQENQ
jgi:hypothetical protein